MLLLSFCLFQLMLQSIIFSMHSQPISLKLLFFLDVLVNVLKPTGSLVSAEKGERTKRMLFLPDNQCVCYIAAMLYCKGNISQGHGKIDVCTFSF